jgi:hypothetical protein
MLHPWLRILTAFTLVIVLAPSRGLAQVIKSGPSACPTIALTFDLCPVRKGAGYDKALIDYLIEHKIPATFFMSGQWIAKHDPEVEQLLGIGFFEVGTHGDVHAHLPMQAADDQGGKFSVRLGYSTSTMPMTPSFFAPHSENIMMRRSRWSARWGCGSFNGTSSQEIRIQCFQLIRSWRGLTSGPEAAASSCCMPTAKGSIRVRSSSA